ncbi:DUF1120 domain-containing protein [Pseudomonas kitaguniensis]|uniref:DUF1120 domain-containing protein n=1 Tax=Pseudomonas kitaguniensis TaxID=2607908 RepID=UPI003D05176D
MNFPKKLVLGSLLLLGANSAFALDRAELTVIGTIAPTACTPTFAGGGIVDYGLIPSSTLDPAVATVLATRSISYTIHCDAPISVGTSWTDERSGSSPIDNTSNFGLGMQGANKIGSYTLRQLTADATGDGASVNLVFRNGTTGAWAQADASSSQLNNGTRMQSYAPLTTLVPGAYTDFGGTIQVITSIAPTNTLDLTTAVTLDGLSTMTVRYL